MTVQLKKTKSAESFMSGTIGYSLNPTRYAAQWDVYVDGNLKGRIAHRDLRDLKGKLIYSGNIKQLRREHVIKLLLDRGNK